MQLEYGFNIIIELRSLKVFHKVLNGKCRLMQLDVSKTINIGRMIEIVAALIIHQNVKLLTAV